MKISQLIESKKDEIADIRTQLIKLIESRKIVIFFKSSELVLSPNLPEYNEHDANNLKITVSGNSFGLGLNYPDDSLFLSIRDNIDSFSHQLDYSLCDHLTVEVQDHSANATQPKLVLTDSTYKLIPKNIVIDTLNAWKYNLEFKNVCIDLTKLDNMNITGTLYTISCDVMCGAPLNKQFDTVMLNGWTKLFNGDHQMSVEPLLHLHTQFDCSLVLFGEYPDIIKIAALPVIDIIEHAQYKSIDKDFMIAINILQTNYQDLEHHSDRKIIMSATKKLIDADLTKYVNI